MKNCTLEIWNTQRKRLDQLHYGPINQIFGSVLQRPPVALSGKRQYGQCQQHTLLFLVECKSNVQLFL